MHRMTTKSFLLALLPFVYLVFLLFRIDPSLDIDLGRHLRMGELIMQCRCIPEVNTFSFTTPTAYARNHSWLSEVVFFQVASMFGISSLLLLKGIIVFVVFTIVYLLSFRKEAIGVSVLFSLLSLALFAPRFTVRPELFSYLFIALFLLLISLYRRKKMFWILWSIPLLLVLWVNMHIYFLIGVALFLAFFLEELLKQKKFQYKFVPLVGCVLLAPFLNPAFLNGAIYPLTVFSNYGAPIIENYPAARLLTFYTPVSSQFFSIVLFELLSCFALAGVLLHPRKEMVTAKLAALMGLILGQLLVRCVALFALLGLPFVTREYLFIRDQIAKPLKKKFHVGFTVFLFVAFLLLVSLQLRTAIVHQQFGFSFSNSYGRAVDFLVEKKLQGNFFHNPAIGNYLIYRLYPRERVFLDGRPEAYPEKLFEEYFAMLGDTTYFNERADKYGISLVMYSPIEYPEQSRIFLSQLLKDKKWEPVFWDGGVAIFVRNNAANATLISEQRKVRDTLTLLVN